MVKHIVCWQMTEANGKTRHENAITAAKLILTLKDKIDVIRKFEIGIIDEKASKENFDLILISEFDNFDELEQYKNHPEHIKVVELLKTIRINKAAIDYESQ